MTFEHADKIVTIYGRYLEYCSKITFVFLTKIPESFLPFPKDIIEEALNIMAEHYYKIGDMHGVNLMRETCAELIPYIDDEEALLEAAKLFNNKEWRDAFIPSLKQMQKDWLKTQGNFETYF